MVNKIAIASDHAGFRLKSFIIEEYLAKKKFNFFDLGTNSDKSVDYPKFAKKSEQIRRLCLASTVNLILQK